MIVNLLKPIKILGQRDILTEHSYREVSIMIVNLLKPIKILSQRDILTEYSYREVSAIIEANI